MSEEAKNLNGQLNEDLKWKIKDIYHDLKTINSDSRWASEKVNWLNENEFNNLFEDCESQKEGMFKFFLKTLDKIKSDSCYLLEILDNIVPEEEEEEWEDDEEEDEEE